MKTFKELIFESFGSKSKEIENLENWVKEKGGKVFISDKKSVINLTKIEFPKEMQGQGLGTQFMEKLTQIADQQEKIIALDPDTSFGASSKSRLKKFYQNFGFVENKGSNKNFEIMKEMYREPKQ